jgi:hypothetical protein
MKKFKIDYLTEHHSGGLSTKWWLSYTHIQAEDFRQAEIVSFGCVIQYLEEINKYEKPWHCYLKKVEITLITEVTNG